MVFVVRILHSLLLVAGILACPHRCLLAAQAAPAAQEKAAHCTCCASARALCSPDDRGALPATPVGDDGSAPVGDGGSDCLCDGAVMDAASSRIAIDAALLPNSLMTLTDLFAPSAGDLAAPSDHHPPLLALESGRQVRLFIQSLLL